MMRIALFLVTNIAVLVVLAIVMHIFGINSYLAQDGSGLNLSVLLFMSAVMGFTGSFISLFISKWMAKKSMGVKLVSNPQTPDEIWLMETVAELAAKAGVKMPEVGIFPAAQANAFATGWNRNDALVAVSLGLLQRFDRDQIKAVLGHELGHVANGDMVTLSLIQGVVNTFVIFLSRVVGYVIDQAIFKSRSGFGPGYFITVIVTQIVFSILASMIVMRFSRWREFRADRAGAQLAGTASMIGALQRLQTESENPPEMPDAIEAFGIRSGKTSGILALFASHPPIEDRIKALQQSQA
ncbi:Protease HtpX [BD1-7 clade bacterium]|uniref:Protease HtpX n=1 Tax=BD1-7 clade bacterium TaxID=2029982 RepID=A0A5S9NML3_9GAMM|nr:Protease HtpX [BD1-7 clade bacterium]CAA0094436.1 Protease HtpX [BD1-7 clade bacterium]